MGEERVVSAERAERDAMRARNSVVTRPIGRLQDDIVPRKNEHRGAKKLMTPRKMKNAINRYFAHCEDVDDVPSIKGMMIHMGMYKDLFYRYLKYPEFTDMMEQARLHIVNWTEIDVYNTKGQAAGKLAYMKNVHDWTDRLETNNTTEVKHITVEDARRKIEHLAPKLLEVLGSQQVVNQIGKDEAEEVEVERVQRRV